METEQGPRPRVLLVDDEERILRILARALSAQFDVILAHDGHEGMKALEREESLDAVVADHLMPGCTGVDLLAAAAARHPSAARVLCTASDDPSDLADAVNRAHVHRFFAKPLRLVDLRSGLEGAVKELRLERENRRLLDELEAKNRALEVALDEVRGAEARLQIEVARATEQLRATNQELERLALRDPLTGLYNRRYFEEALLTEVARARRYQLDVALLFIDVDHFKNYNDTHGHPAGDALLSEFAGILLGVGPENRRASDVPARYGGEEFVLVLPRTGTEGAAVVARRLCQRVERHPFRGGETQPAGKITISVGYASFPQDADSAEDLVEAADRGVLEAKRQGRNRALHLPRPPA